MNETQTASAKNFRFFDNRQKYLLFVNTCSEKWVIANRIVMELEKITPKPPAVRIFDAGVGDGTVLTRVMRAAHAPKGPGRFSSFSKTSFVKSLKLNDFGF